METTVQHPSGQETTTDLEKSNSTALATTDETDGTESVYPLMPAKGDKVRLQVIETGGVARAIIGDVLGVSSLDENRQGENGEPYLTVAWLSDPTSPLLGTPEWHKAYTRTGPIHHHTAPSSKAGS